MKNRRYKNRLPAIAAVCALALATAGGRPLPAIAAPSPDAVVPPAGVALVRQVQAGGEQIYACRAASAGTFAWTLVGPNATLFNDDGTVFGHHDVGPRWTAADGSTVAGDGVHPLQKIAVPDGVPELLLRVASASDAGLLAGITYVTRTHTQGGLAPAAGCDAAHANTLAGERYTAIYAFYR